MFFKSSSSLFGGREGSVKQCIFYLKDQRCKLGFTGLRSRVGSTLVLLGYPGRMLLILSCYSRFLACLSPVLVVSIAELNSLFSHLLSSSLNSILPHNADSRKCHWTACRAVAFSDMKLFLIRCITCVLNVYHLFFWKPEVNTL